MVTLKTCFCGRKINFESCCYPYISYQKKPSTAEELMRSRYSAFVTRNSDYIKRTMRDPALKYFDGPAISKSTLNWIKLEIVAKKNGGTADNEGSVTFKAFYKNEDRDMVFYLYEKSYFSKIDGTWFYVDGDVTPPKEA